MKEAGVMLVVNGGWGGGGRFPMAVLRSRICGRGRDFGVRWSDDEGKEGKMGYVIC